MCKLLVSGVASCCSEAERVEALVAHVHFVVAPALQSYRSRIRVYAI